MNPYAGWDEYGLQHQAEHLFAAELYAELYDLTLDQGWLAAQRVFDASRQTYVASLDWALQAAEIDKGSLPVLLVLTLLRATIASLASRMPVAAIEVMARLGLGKQAEATLAMQTDPLLKCEALCRLARMAGSETHGTRAYEMLLQAETATTTVTNPRIQTHMLALIATAARAVEAADIFQRASTGIRATYTNQDWLVTQIAREFDLLNQSDYLLLLAAWDREEGSQQQSGLSLSNKYAALSRLLPVVVTKRDRVMLKAIVAAANPLLETNRGLSPYDITEMVTVLAEVGAVDKAMSLINTWHEANERYRMYDTQPLLEAMARGAGERGDVKSIEKAADLAQTYLQTKTTSSPAWEKWLSRLRAVGQRALGIKEVARTQIRLAGVEGLAADHPQQAQALWEQIRGDAGWLQRLLDPNQALMQTILDIESSHPQTGSKETTPLELPRSLAAGLMLARWQPDVNERDKDLADYAEILARLGEAERALATVAEISEVDKQASALAEIVKATLARNEIESALHAAAEITKEDTRQWALNMIAETLLAMPHEQARNVLQQLAEKTDVLTEEALVQTTSFPVLMGELASATSIPHTLSMVRGTFGSAAILAVLPALGEIAVIQEDVAAARQVLAQIEVVGIKRTRSEILAEKLPAPPGWTQKKERERLQQIETVAALARQWGTAATRQNKPALAREWMAIATAAFDLARQQARQLLPLAARGWPVVALAGAARQLRDGKRLKALQKQAAALGGVYEAQGVRDEALVHVAVGLTETGDYLQREMLFQPPAVTDIHHKHYRAQALAEMSEVVRAAPPQKRLFRAGLDREDLQYFADRLLDQAHQVLGIEGLRLLGGFTGFKQRPSLGIGGREIEPSTTQSMKASPFDNSEQWPITYRSARHALVAIVGVFVRAGRSNDVVQIATAAPAPGHKPAVVAVKALARSGEVDKARQLLQSLSAEPDRVLAVANLAAALARTEPVQAEQLTQSEVLPRLWDETHIEMALIAIGETAVNLPPPARLRLIHEVLRVSRTRNRVDVLAVLATLIPAVATLMDGTQRRNMIEKMVETETWWQNTAPSELE